MTTIEDKLKEMLFNHGLFEDQTATVMEMMKADEVNEAMEGRWGENVEDYPPVLLSVLWLSMRDCALRYIDANCPKAWFRSLFVNEGEK